MTFLLCDPGWCVHKSDVQNKRDDNTRHMESTCTFPLSGWCLKKNLNASRPSEHPPVRGKMSKRLGEIIHTLQIQILFMAFKWVPRWK